MLAKFRRLFNGISKAPSYHGGDVNFGRWQSGILKRISHGALCNAKCGKRMHKNPLFKAKSWP
jgi:hypothetical protein